MSDRITAQNAAILLVDHQPGVLGMGHSVPADEVVRNATILARLGEEMNIPLVLTTTRETEGFLGTTILEIQEAAPNAYAQRVARGGSLNAFSDQRLVQAVSGTGRRKLVVAGVLTDVCLYNSVVDAVERGYEVLIPADANTSASELVDRVTYQRLMALGHVQVFSTWGVVFELFNDLSTDEGRRAERIVSASVAVH